ncbi:MAG: hypothetical protein H7X99_01240 [Saprospiraceae bacterium]|nr:hypothetical protein [Saprospiraceae bacterium]
MLSKRLFMTPTIIEKPTTFINADVLKSLKKYTSCEGQVIIHGVCKTTYAETFVRIWPTTYLFDQYASNRSELVHYENISGYPVWTRVPPNTEFVFTLLFAPLPKSCNVFDLKEIIPQSNGFHVSGILRNETDVYYLDFSGEEF